MTKTLLTTVLSMLIMGFVVPATAQDAVSSRGWSGEHPGAAIGGASQTRVAVELVDDVSDEPVDLLGITGWSLLAVGGAGLITGGVFAGLALTNEKDYNAAVLEEERRRHLDRLERNDLISDVVIFSSAGLAAFGITLLVIKAFPGHSERRRARNRTAGTAGDNNTEEPALVLGPTLGVSSDRLAVGLVGRF